MQLTPLVAYNRATVPRGGKALGGRPSSRSGLRGSFKVAPVSIGGSFPLQAAGKTSGR